MSEASTQVEVMLMDVRLSFFHGYHPMQGTNDQGQPTKNYTTHAIFPPDHPAVALVKAAQRQVAAAGWGPQAQQVLQQLGAQDRLCLHKGDVSKPGMQGYEGMLYVSANSKVRPRILATRNGVNVEVEEGDPLAPFSGCYANVKVAIYAQGPNGKPSKYGKRINAQWMGVQFVRVGEAFGGGRIATLDEFGVVAEDADAAPPGALAGGADDLI